MKRTLFVLIALSLTTAYLGRQVKGDTPPEEQTYVAVFYCLNAQSVLHQRQSGKHKIVVGYSLPSITPSPDEMEDCTKHGGVVMTGYVQITPPFASLDEGASAQK